MAGDLTKEAEKIIDLKLLNLKNEIYDKMTENQEPYNRMIREMHQELMGYGERKGILGQLLEFESIIEDHGSRLEKLETNHIDKIETKKVIGAIIGSVLGTGGILTVIVLTILNSGVTP